MKHILIAIKYLNDQIEDIVEKAKNEIIVKNSDDRSRRLRGIRQLERQIDKVDKEIEMTNKTGQGKTDITPRGLNSINSVNSVAAHLLILLIK